MFSASMPKLRLAMDPTIWLGQSTRGGALVQHLLIGWGPTVFIIVFAIWFAKGLSATVWLNPCRTVWPSNSVNRLPCEGGGAEHSNLYHSYPQHGLRNILPRSSISGILAP